MEYKVFYSWQSDLDSQTNEQFIEGALKNAIQKINDDSSLSINLVFDRDIANTPGSPEIAATILAKIEQSDIFIGDVSIINNRQSRNATGLKKIRKMPNPNVLVELGYAIKTLGTGKIILINNLAFGRHEELPFDFRHRYVVGYTLTQDGSKERREAEHQALETQLEQELRKIILNLKQESFKKANLCDEAINAIKNSQPNQVMLISEFVDWMMKELEDNSPPFPKAEGNELDFITESVDRTTSLILDFTRLFSAIANFNSAELPLIYKRTFEQIIGKYNPSVGFTGSSYIDARMKFFKLVGHELFITMVALLLDAEKLDVIADILDETLYVENDPYLYGGAQNVSFTYISMTGESSHGIGKPMITSLSEKLDQRHSEGELAGIMPFIRIVEADYFLSLRQNPRWCPIISNRLIRTPKFLVKSFKNKYAQKLLKPLAVNDVDEIKRLLSLQSDAGDLLRWRFNFDANKIGTE